MPVTSGGILGSKMGQGIQQKGLVRRPAANWRSTPPRTCHGSKGIGLSLRRRYGRHDRTIPYESECPFLFFIRDHLTNSLLFLGAVMDPAAR
jgi:hypothetical protein